MAQGFEIGIETNGTLLPPPGIDWICVSPKADAEQKLKRGDELKLVYPQDKARAGAFCRPGFPHFFLQPMDNDRARRQYRGGDGLLPGPSAMAAVAADPQIAGNSLTASGAKRAKEPCAGSMTPPRCRASAGTARSPHLTALFEGHCHGFLVRLARSRRGGGCHYRLQLFCRLRLIACVRNS